MDANELRIGNYIKPIGDFPVWKVTSRDFEYIENNTKDYEPIPLTEKWLINFGFVKQMGCMFTNKITIRNGIKGKYQLRVSDGLDFVFIKHVHQLQNLYFALTGEELTLKQNDNKTSSTAAGIYNMRQLGTKG